MKNKIKGFFKNNKLLKLVSFFVALGIWLIVVNVSDPEIKSSVSQTIEVDYDETLTNLDKYYNIDSYNAKVSFKVRTTRRTQVSASDFRVYVDMRDYSITGALPVYVTVDDRVKDIVSDVSVTPLVVHATTEDMQEKTFDLNPTIVGTPQDGFEKGELSYSPSHVTIYGPNSEIGKISRIGFEVNIEGAASAVWGNAEFLYYDANDNKITPDTRLVIKNSVSYNIPIYEKKMVTLMAQTTGDPAEGYELGAVNIEPGFVEIYGDKSVIDSMNELVLPADILNIGGATSDVSASVDVKDYLPDGVYTTNVGNTALVARINKQGTIAEQESGAAVSTETGAESTAASEGAEAATAAGANNPDTTHASVQESAPSDNIREGNDTDAQAQESTVHETKKHITDALTHNKEN